MISDLTYTSQVLIHLIKVRPKLIYSLSDPGSIGLPIRGLCHLVNALIFIVDEAGIRIREKSWLRLVELSSISPLRGTQA